jgi:hypothetical protein
MAVLALRVARNFDIRRKCWINICPKWVLYSRYDNFEQNRHLFLIKILCVNICFKQSINSSKFKEFFKTMFANQRIGAMVCVVIRSRYLGI